MQIRKYNIPLSQNERQNPHDHLSRFRKAFDKIQHPFIIKNSQQIRYRWDMPQHSKAL